MADLKISQFEDGGSVETTDEIAAVRAGMNTKVFVGSAAALDVGEDIGNLVQIQDYNGNPALPALDSSLLTNVGGGVSLYSAGASYNFTGTGTVVVKKVTGSASAVVWTHSAGDTINIKDGKGDAGTNNITITLNSGLIDNSASVVINSNYNAVTLKSDGTNVWVI